MAGRPETDQQAMRLILNKIAKRRYNECPDLNETWPAVPGSYSAERRHARDEREEQVRKPFVGDADPMTHPCARVPDLVVWNGPRRGSALTTQGIGA